MFTRLQAAALGCGAAQLGVQARRFWLALGDNCVNHRLQCMWVAPAVRLVLLVLQPSLGFSKGLSQRLPVRA